ncbi:hypothetical protein BGX34_008643, partial [Mortierella sp. NVP85]
MASPKGPFEENCTTNQTPPNITDPAVTAVPDPFVQKEDGTTATQDSATTGANLATDASKAAAAASTTPRT